MNFRFLHDSIGELQAARHILRQALIGAIAVALSL
jgi:hypothetical protein